MGVDVYYQTVSPDGKYVLMLAGAVGQPNIYLYPLDELAREPAVARQLTSTPGFKVDAQFSPDGLCDPRRVPFGGSFPLRSVRPGRHLLRVRVTNVRTRASAMQVIDFQVE